MGIDAGDPDRIRRMTATLEHRGPDEDGFYVATGVELGMRRLAIIDVKQGRQPATDEQGSVQVILNGEIYNFVDLRQELHALGHTFTSLSDTEVIAHAYEEWGNTCVQRLHGMFAFAIWDSRTQELLLARDRLGKKPLLYARLPDGGIVFASEARAIIRSGWDAQPDFDALNHILAFGYAPIEGSAFRDIVAVPPAHTLTWHHNQIHVDRYWSLDWSAPQPMSLPDAIECSESLIRRAVDRRLVSERPLGVFLSGGIDSTVVAALANEAHSEPISTFTVSFGDPRFDEASHAAAVAKVLGTDHHTIPVAADPAFVADELPRIFDQPFADSSAIPTYLLAKFAREHIVVALGGDGGDETFTGYDRYLAAPRLQRLNPLLTAAQPLSGPTARLASLTGDRRLHRVARALHGYASLGDRYAALMTLTSVAQRQRLWNTDAVNAQALAQPEDHFRKLWSSVNATSDIDRMVAVDLNSYLPGDLLVKADIATMAASLELRSPLLDTSVLEFAATIPWQLRTRNGASKYILKQIAYRYVPEEILDRPKMGFGIPRARWLRHELKDVVHDVLLGTTASQRGWFNPAAVAAIVNQHQKGVDRDSILWPLLMIELWARTWID